LDNKPTLMSLVALSVGLCALLGSALAHKVRRAEPPLARDQRRSQMKTAGALFALGLALAVTGFIPIVSLYVPSLSATESRFNLFALPGASLAIAAILWAVALLVGRRENHADVIMLCGALPLLVLGVGAQLAVRHDATIAWQHQKQIWAGLADAAPNLTDDSALYFVLPDSQDAVRLLTPWRRTPLSAPWEISSALQVLYGNPTLRGDRLLFGERRSPGNPKLLPDGIIEYWTRDKVPYDRAVFVAYDVDTSTLRVIEDLQTELSLSWSPIGYAPRLRISAPPISGFPNRWLVDLPTLPN
jgi:MFS family permease